MQSGIVHESKEEMRSLVNTSELRKEQMDLRSNYELLVYFSMSILIFLFTFCLWQWWSVTFSTFLLKIGNLVNSTSTTGKTTTLFCLFLSLYLTPETQCKGQNVVHCVRGMLFVRAIQYFRSVDNNKTTATNSKEKPRERCCTNRGTFLHTRLHFWQHVFFTLHS